MLEVSRHTQAAESVGPTCQATAEPLVGSRGLPWDRRQHTATHVLRPGERRAPAITALANLARQGLRRDRAQGRAAWGAHPPVAQEAQRVVEALAGLAQQSLEHVKDVRLAAEGRRHIDAPGQPSRRLSGTCQSIWG